MNSRMDNENKTADFEIIYPQPIKLLDEQEHHNTGDLAKKINEQSVLLNRLMDYLKTK